MTLVLICVSETGWPGSSEDLPVLPPCASVTVFILLRSASCLITGCDWSHSVSCVFSRLTLAGLLPRISTAGLFEGDESGDKGWRSSSAAFCQDSCVPSAGAGLCWTDQGMAEEEGAPGPGTRRSEGKVTCHWHYCIDVSKYVFVWCSLKPRLKAIWFL